MSGTPIIPRADLAALARHRMTQYHGGTLAPMDLGRMHGPVTAERAAMDRDPVAFGTYLGRVAQETRRLMGAEGMGPVEAMEFGFSLTGPCPVELRHRFPSNVERDAVRILIGAQS